VRPEIPAVSRPATGVGSPFDRSRGPTFQTSEIVRTDS
jgi:hypothetical protein